MNAIADRNMQQYRTKRVHSRMELLLILGYPNNEAENFNRHLTGSGQSSRASKTPGGINDGRQRS
jgi:hypothetical protein